MVACSRDDRSEVVGTLDLRPPSAASGVPPPSIPEACSLPPSLLQILNDHPFQHQTLNRRRLADVHTR